MGLVASPSSIRTAIDGSSSARPAASQRAGRSWPSPMAAEMMSTLAIGGETLVAGAGPGNREGLARLGGEAPDVAARVQAEPDDPERLGVERFAAGDPGRGARMVVAAGADDDLAHAPGGVDRAAGVQRGEALVEVLVGGEDEVGPGARERVPDRGQRGRVLDDGAARGEARLVEEGHRAGLRMRGEVGLDPLLLRAADVAGAREAVALAVDRQHVPGADVERVP